MYKTILAALLGLAIASLPLGAQPANDKVVLVLDGSNSMWGQIEGVAKITIAKQVLVSMLDGWQPETAFGLVAYGHREEGDCNDIETLVGLGPFDGAVARSAVSGVTPRGKTPLTAAVRHAATLFARSGVTGRIVLLTDGIETCEGDPCRLGEELAAQGVGLTVHIVGFDMIGQDVSPLRCLAEVTGGSYRDASDADELAAALAHDVEGETAPRNVTMRGLDGDGDLLDRDVQWAIYGDGGAESVANRIAPEAQFALPAGSYRVVASLGDVVIEKSFDVAAGENELVELIFAAGTVNLTAVLADGLPPYDRILEWDMALPGGDVVATESGDAVSFTLMPGRYRGLVKGEDIDIPFDLEISGGVTNDQTVILHAGIVVVSGLGNGGLATKGHVSWSLYPPDSGGRGRPLAREVRRETRFLIASGRYLLVGEYKGEAISQLIEVEAGATMSREMSFKEQ